MVIRLIGDSHGNVFMDSAHSHKEWEVIRIGSPTAYHLEAYEKFWEYVKYSMKPEDTIIPIVGEIDCRTHIHWQAKQKGHSLAAGVLDTILHLDHVFTRLRDMNVSFAVWNVVPAGHWTADLVYRQKYHIAPYKERILIHQLYHEMLALWCREHNYPLIDIWSSIIADDGVAKKDMKCDEVHLAGQCLPFYIEEFKKLGIWPENTES
jgi:hypothetical protein